MSLGRWLSLSGKEIKERLKSECLENGERLVSWDRIL